MLEYQYENFEMLNENIYFGLYPVSKEQNRIRKIKFDEGLPEKIKKSDYNVLMDAIKFHMIGLEERL